MTHPPVLLSATASGGPAIRAAPPRPIYLGGDLLRQVQRRWSIVAASLTELRCGPSLQIALWSEATQLSVMLEEVGGRASMCISPCARAAAPSGKPLPLSLIPPRHGARGEARGLRYLRHIVLQFDGDALANTREKRIDLESTLAARPMFACPRLLRLARLFAEACHDPEPGDTLYGDGLSAGLLDSLAQLAAPTMPEEARCLLAPWQLRKAIEILRERLDENVRMQELAAETHLSVSYFCRAFKASTGMPPHRWQLNARVEKVKELLLDDRESMAQIAILAGFADQAHMTRTFSRLAGISPGLWRRPHQAVPHAA
ncbi:helix-turn-helix transcriptional regulator [Roseomonas frigidaquae]|uniref:Helix-turn-helix transcriptional regulator n=1 Tax=Falsiroseomonas frigidaquae TaxID=487318 RepID=A0ABX1F853_9PROT|nr:AraC family transcriptional regulator [Falsiroseomonas frigidaquae]NKE48591.1 helix-turn-helix transcriptional regulator [Falsiroseomonas frigidaquae]